MYRLKDYFSKFTLPFPVENFLNAFVGLIIFIILTLAMFALTRPIPTEHYKQVLKYSQQASFPKTQHLAQQLQQQSQITRVEYLRLLRAYHFESSRVKQYPAVDGSKTR